jgi:pyridoxal phosphate enzyme (YggS family)
VNAPSPIHTNLREVRRRIAAAADRSGRSPESVTLIAVSKTFGADEINAAIEAGADHLGENRVQELRDKIEKIHSGPKWHMIGHLQSNKVRDAVRLFDVIQSIDSVSLAQRVAAESEKQQKLIDVFIEVNIGDEPQKSGIELRGLEPLVDQLVKLPALRLRGLMAIPPVGDATAETRPFFRRMKELQTTMAERYGGGYFEDLSMGMTDDFEVAIEEGSTMVRVGRAIFGSRS